MSKLLSVKDYKILALANELVEIYDVLNRNGAANFTVCPHCHVDDFVHVEGCPLAIIKPKPNKDEKC